MAQVATGLAAVLLVASIVNPVHFPPWTSYHSEVPAFAAGALLLAACALRGVRRFTMPVIVLLGLLATPWLQLAAGQLPYAGDAWLVTAYLGLFAAAWWWGSSARSVSETPATLDLLAVCLLLMGLLAAFQSYAQWLQVESSFADWIYVPVGSTRSTGNFAQPNQLSTMLLMAVAAGGAWMVRGRLGLLPGWAWLLAGGWAVVLTQSRTGLLSAAVMVAVLVTASVASPSLRRWNKHAVAWLALLFAGTWLLQATDWEWGRTPLGADAMTSVGPRPLIWRQMIEAAMQAPWSGHGWLQIGPAQQVGATEFPGVDQVTYAHNLLLDAAVMLGLPLATLVFGLAAVWLLRRLLRLGQDDGTGLAALCIVLPWLVHAQLELPHAYSYFLVPVGALLGLLDARTEKPVDRCVATPPWVPAVMAGALLSVLIPLAWEYAQVEEDFRIHRFQNRKLGSLPPGYIEPELAMLTQYRDLLRAMRLRASPAMAPEDIDVLERSARRFTWAPLQFRAALAHALNGRPEQARERLLVIRNLFPAEIVEEGRDNWRRLQGQIPELAGVPFP